MSPSPQSSFQKDWQDLCSFLTKWYYKPDLEGLRIVLCCYLSHFYLTSPPVWLSIIGLPGSGKTELGIKPFQLLSACVQSISTLTTNCFLSGFGENNGILDKLIPVSKGSDYKHGIWLFSDFTTTLLSRDQFSRTEIMGILRRIYDGAFEKDVGNKATKLTWKGKVTCIAACTPDIEDYWAMHRDMGERWLNIRWGNLAPSYKEMKELSRFTKLHEGHEEQIHKELTAKIANLIDKASSGPAGIPESDMLDSVGILLEELRTNVKRDSTGKVIDKGNKQFNTRTTKSLAMVCKASAALRRDDKFIDEDFNLAKRIAIDSIPHKRYEIVKRLVELYPDPVRKGELAKSFGIARTSFDRVIEDLRYLRVIEVHDYAEDDLEESGGMSKAEMYDFTRPGAKAVISLSPEIVDIIRDVGEI